MKIISLTVENVKRIKHIIITPKSWIVKIAGRNKQGKTSVLDSFMYAIEGGKNIPDGAIHDGAKKGRIEVDFGGLKITRLINEKTTTVTVKNDKGEVMGAQGFIDDMLSGNTTNAITFLNKKPAEQRKMLADLVGADTSLMDLQIKKAYTERTEIGRDVTRLEGQITGMKFTDGMPDKETPAAAIVAKLDAVRAHNKIITDLRKEKTATAEMIAEISKQVEELLKKRERLEQQVGDIDMKLLGETEENEAVLVQQLTEIDATNRTVRQNLDRARIGHDLSKKRLEYEAKTEFIEAKEAEKTALIKNAQFPVPGLSLGEDAVIYNGHPLSECSCAEQIIAATSILSKIIPADGIRALRVDQGSELDDDNMKLIEEIAEREQVQIWISRVQNKPGESGNEIFIEDGEIKS
jgi:predicted ATP-dependent endonuclease of OLD family